MFRKLLLFCIFHSSHASNPVVPTSRPADSTSELSAFTLTPRHWINERGEKIEYTDKVESVMSPWRSSWVSGRYYTTMKELKSGTPKFEDVMSDSKSQLLKAKSVQEIYSSLYKPLMCILYTHNEEVQTLYGNAESRCCSCFQSNGRIAMILQVLFKATPRIIENFSLDLSNESAR